MNETGSETLNSSEAGDGPVRREGGLAALSVIGAFLASACCVVPLLLVMLGISGAWIGNLTMLEPYKPYVVAATLVPLGLGFWQVYFKPKTVCEPGSYCARPRSAIITKAALWIATVIIVLAITIGWWAPLFY
ncbi:mercuric transporter MerT family protein [Nitratireductor luteus]|uniref:mercuric transporter MerT family protein n=1 Tax=Nitratireductor luteus TaxID=2976980 RepID=UPI00223F43E8|nr:mercuric transporter MerT family protein [Nitratireductor luteus]